MKHSQQKPLSSDAHDLQVNAIRVASPEEARRAAERTREGCHIGRSHTPPPPSRPSAQALLLDSPHRNVRTSVYTHVENVV